jgi:hypothetical protein
MPLHLLSFYSDVAPSYPQLLPPKARDSSALLRELKDLLEVERSP